MPETSGTPHWRPPQEAQPTAEMQPAANERTFADRLNEVEDTLDREYALQHAENSHDENLRAQAAAYREAQGMPAPVEPIPLPPMPKPYFTVTTAGRELLERELPEIARELGMEGQEAKIAAAIAHLGISRQRWPDFLAHTPAHERDAWDVVRTGLLRTALRHHLDKEFYDQGHTSVREQMGIGGQIRVLRQPAPEQGPKAAAAQPAPAPESKAAAPTAPAEPAPKATQPETAPAQPTQPQAPEANKKAAPKVVVHEYVPTPDRVQAANDFLANLGRRPDGKLTDEALGQLAALERNDSVTAEVITTGFDGAQRSLFTDYKKAHPLPREGRRLFGRKKK